jgi:hypothetical protein
MNTSQSDITIEHRCEALTISEIPPIVAPRQPPAPGRAGRSVRAMRIGFTSIGSMMTIAACPVFMADMPPSLFMFTKPPILSDRRAASRSMIGNLTVLGAKAAFNF